MFPAQLARSGLPTALASLLARTGSTGRLVIEDFAVGRRFDPRIEAAAYFCVAEAMHDLGPGCCVTSHVLNTGAVANQRPPKSSLTCKQRLAYRKPVGDVFKALADPTRRVILDELQERSGQTLFELCVRLTTKHGLGSSRQAISQHLAVLESAGLVITRRQGRYKYHDLDTTPLRTIVERWQIGH